MNNQKFLKQAELLQLLQISRTSLYRMDKRGEIPGRVRLSKGTVRYWRPAVEDWLRGKVNSR